MMARARAGVIALVLLLFAAVAWVYVAVWLRAGPPEKVSASFDVYAAHLPNVIYALESLRRGHGLLWNSLQNCGQPFLPSTLLGLLYPFNLVFLLVDVDTGFLVVTVLHLAVAGAFAYALCREYVGPIAALCGGLTFMLGGSCLALATWLPTTILGPWIWLPAAAALTERLLRAPNRQTAIGLGACLAMSLLAGYPQLTVFIYQFLTLRVLWDLATNRAARHLRVLAALAIGGAIPAALGAAYLLPALEFAGESIRSGGLSPVEGTGSGFVSWRQFTADGGGLANLFIPIFTLVPTVLATLALTARVHRRVVVFYVLVAILYLALACSPRLFEVYRMLPAGTVFRDPSRFRWVAAFALVVPVAIGVDVVTRPTAGRLRSVATAAAGLLLGVFVFSIVSRRSYLPLEKWCLGLSAAVVLWAAARPRHAPVLSLALPVVVAVNLFTVTTTPFARRLSDPTVIYRRAAAFDFVRERIGPLDRIHLVGRHTDFSLMHKSASVFGLPAITDYEPQTSRRYADYTMRTFGHGPLQSVNHFYYRPYTVPAVRALFDLTAARWIIADAQQIPPKSMMATMPVRWEEGTLKVLENPTALPRAFYVPRIEVTSSPEALVARLASARSGFPRAVLVEQTPADGFIGAEDPTATAPVTSLEDDSERLIVRLTATHEGFLFISDQDYPGWVATVNGETTPILRANYAFRVVRVPAGASEVVFRYRPASIRYGVAISLASLAIALLVAFTARRRWTR